MKKNLEFKDIRIKKVLMTVLCVVLLVGICLGIYKLFFNKLTTYITISYDQFTEKLEEGDKFALFIGSEQCSHCATFKTTLNRIIATYNIEVFYLNIGDLSEEEYAYLKSHFPFTGTPTTIIIDDGSEYERQACRIEGAKSYDYTVERFKKAGIIEE